MHLGGGISCLMKVDLLNVDYFSDKVTIWDLLIFGG